jgi:hypothetical protein
VRLGTGIMATVTPFLVLSGIVAAIHFAPTARRRKR